MMNREAFVRAQDEHLDIMIALAFDLDDAEAVQQLSETDDPPLTTDDERRADVLLSSAFTKAGQQQRQMRANGFRAVLRKVLPAALRAAACLLLILTVSFSVAFATSAVFRSKVLTLVVHIDEERNWVFVDFLEDQDSAFDVPQNWTWLYFPSALPEGYDISMTDSTPPRIIYQNHLGQNFCYAEYDESDSISVSTENATTRFINIGGIVAHLVESESFDGSAHVTTITWTNDHRWFSLTSENMTLDTLVKIAASVRKIIH